MEPFSCKIWTLQAKWRENLTYTYPIKVYLAEVHNFEDPDGILTRVRKG